LAVTLGISLGAHVLIAGAMFHHRVAPVPAPDPVDPAPALAGETFELPAPDSVVAPLQNASPSPEVDGVESPSADGDAPAKPTPKQPKGKAAKLASKAGRPSGGHTASADGEAGGTGAPALYGAVVRGFPQAASADPAWKSAAMGSAGDVDLILTIDESGHFVSHQVVGSPSPALASGISRTIALIKGRAFTAKGKTTKLHLSATVASDQVHDGLHGDVFAIGGSYVGTEGNAFFALNIGRRIDVHVRAR
jgi:outer membrane biosynthesis protein TonB